QEGAGPEVAAPEGAGAGVGRRAGGAPRRDATGRVPTRASRLTPPLPGGSDRREPGHPRPPAAIARQTRSGRRGMSRWRTPKGPSASTTALTIAGVDPIVAASPIPFAPSGLKGVVVTVSSVTKAGRSSARGTA